MARAVVALAALGVLAGCSGGEEDGVCVVPADSSPKPEVDRRPLVDGHWRVVYAPLGRDRRQQHATWAVTPSCKSGPCNFRINSDRGARRLFVYDPTFKTWISRDPRRDYCVVQSTYWTRSQITLTPLRGVRSAKRTFATQMFGGRREAPASRRETLRAVRTDPPPGRQRPIRSIRYGETRP
jgi:hypothetical protein